MSRATEGEGEGEREREREGVGEGEGEGEREGHLWSPMPQAEHADARALLRVQDLHHHLSQSLHQLLGGEPELATPTLTPPPALPTHHTCGFIAVLQEL